MDLRGWVVTSVDGMRLVGEHHVTEGGLEREWLSPVYEMRVDCVALPTPVDIPGKGRALMPVPQIVRQLMPVHATPSITRYALPSDARMIDLSTLTRDDQREYVKMIEQIRDGLRQAESGLVVG